MERNNIVHAQVRVKKNFTMPRFKIRPLHQYIGLLILIVIGAVFGALYIKNSGINKTGLEGTGFFMQDILMAGAASKGFASLASSAFFPVSLLICVEFIFGLCIIGFPFEILMPVIHGAWLGAAMASIDIRYGVKGLGICLIFIIPQALLTSLAVMLACREGVRFSYSISRLVFTSKGKNLGASFRVYCYKYVVCFLLVGVASIIQALAIIIFSDIFFS